jgi:crossover junction endodeoxyribonuclease RuvC
MRVLGLDPGTVRMGYGILDGDVAKLDCLEWGCLTATAGEPIHQRLRRLYQGLEQVVERWRPDHLAVEEPFVAPTRGAKSGVAVGQAQAVGLLLAAQHGMEVHRYLPSQVKQSLTDSGAGTKTQVQRMVQLVLGLDELPHPQDASDALAVAISHLRQVRAAERVRLA